MSRSVTLLSLATLASADVLTCGAIKDFYQSEDCCTDGSSGKQVSCSSQYKKYDILNKLNATGDINKYTRLTLWRGDLRNDIDHRYYTPWAERGIMIPYLSEWCLGGMMGIWLQMFNYVDIPGWITTGEEIKNGKVQSIFNFLTTTFEVEFKLGLNYPQDKYKSYYPLSDPSLWTALFGPSGSIAPTFKEWARHTHRKMNEIMDEVEALGHFSDFGVGKGADTCTHCPSEGYNTCNSPPGTKHCGDENHVTFRSWMIRLNWYHLHKVYNMDPDPNKTDFYMDENCDVSTEGNPWCDYKLHAASNAGWVAQKKDGTDTEKFWWVYYDIMKPSMLEKAAELSGTHEYTPSSGWTPDPVTLMP